MYRPVASDDLDRLATRLASLASSTTLPWVFDEASNSFVVVQEDGTMAPVMFNPGDIETQLIEVMTGGLPMLLEAINKKYVIIDRDRIKQKAKK